MRLSLNPSGLDQGFADYDLQVVDSQAGKLHFFRSIPPERVGLNGEYDHSGLAKRVLQELRQRFQAKHLEQLRVTQRGTVVVLSGRIGDRQILEQIATAALGVMGALTVETHGVQLVDQ